VGHIKSSLPVGAYVNHSVYFRIVQVPLLIEGIRQIGSHATTADKHSTGCCISKTVVSKVAFYCSKTNNLNGIRSCDIGSSEQKIACYLISPVYKGETAYILERDIAPLQSLFQNGTAINK
jgi:hypothetical protein